MANHETGWPSESDWQAFNSLLNGALIKTVPEASIYYPGWQGNYTASSCTSLSGSWNNSTLRIENPPSIRSILFQSITYMQPDYTARFLGNNVTCTVSGFPVYNVNVTTVAQIQLAVNLARKLGLR